MKPIVSIAAGLLALGIGIQTSQAAELRAVGSAAANRAFMTVLVEAYNREAGASITLEDNGSTPGIQEVAAGAADLGSSGRHKVAGDEERDAKLTPVGWEALVAIIHPSNPVSNISKMDLRAVLEGRIRNWQELGGQDAPINLVVRKDRMSAVGMLVREQLLQNPNFEYSPDATHQTDTGSIEARVEDDPLALALTGVSSSRMRNVGILKVEGRKPSYEEVAAGRYDLARPLYLVTLKQPSEAVVAFARFATGAEGQKALKQQGTVTLADGAALWPIYNKAARAARKAANF